MRNVNKKTCLKVREKIAENLIYGTFVKFKGIILGWLCNKYI